MNAKDIRSRGGLDMYFSQLRAQDIRAVTSLLVEAQQVIPIKAGAADGTARFTPPSRPRRHVPAVTSPPSRPRRHVPAVTSPPSRPRRHVLAVTSPPSRPRRHAPAVTSSSSTHLEQKGQTQKTASARFTPQQEANASAAPKSIRLVPGPSRKYRLAPFWKK
jgi:hypothetical protein